MAVILVSLSTFNGAPPSYDAVSLFHPYPAPPHFDPLTFLSSFFNFTFLGKKKQFSLAQLQERCKFERDTPGSNLSRSYHVLVWPVARL